MQELPDILKGVKVFPCVPLGKLPATKEGWYVATSDSSQVAEWQRINPDFNWAVATGPSGLFVIDIDPQGLDWWAKLLERDADIREAVGKAFQVRTPRGGLHVYFRGEGPSTASRIAEGIDTRGGIRKDGKIVSGGYVLLPGSRTDKGTYEALPGGQILPLPSSIAGIIPERAKTDTLGLAKNPDADQPRNVSWALDLIKSYVAGGRVSIEGRGGNNTAFQVAASILDKAISPAVCFDLLWEHWNPHCSPPWDEWEIEQIIRNAASYGEDTEGGVKGFQANEDAFAAFVGQEFEPPAPVERSRDKIHFLHEYADGVNDPAWLIPNVLPAQGTGMLYGESGSYKSFLTLDMALCLAFGVPGQWNAPPVKNDVLFFAGEGPVATAKKRWPAWMEWQEIEFRNDHRFLIKDRVPLYTDTQSWENVKADLAELKAKPSLIVIDTLARLLTGMDENSAKDATMVTTFLESLARYYECFVLVVHHTGKDQAKGARGSSAFHSNFDTVISTKLKQGGSELRVRKQKDADVSDELSYFAVKEIGPSIVLERTANLADMSPSKAQSSRYAWASVEEVTRVLAGLGGETSAAVLEIEIAGKYGIDRDVVKKQLAKNDALTFLRPAQGKWAIPKMEFDL
ncbi:MAG: hypothetical protein C0510_06785 [Erythrobacter sp.]|nr:hypothetical protein [Erythrobacter sp.]